MELHKNAPAGGNDAFYLTKQHQPLTQMKHVKQRVVKFLSDLGNARPVDWGLLHGVAKGANPVHLRLADGDHETKEWADDVALLRADICKEYPRAWEAVVAHIETNLNHKRTLQDLPDAVRSTCDPVMPGTCGSPWVSECYLNDFFDKDTAVRLASALENPDVTAEELVDVWAGFPEYSSTWFHEEDDESVDEDSVEEDQDQNETLQDEQLTPAQQQDWDRYHETLAATFRTCTNREQIVSLAAPKMFVLPLLRSALS